MIRDRRALCSAALIPLLFAAAALAGPQVTGLKAVHREGQTFLTWQEAGAKELKPDLLLAEFKKELDAAGKDKALRYRVYRSDKPITALAGLVPIAEVAPYSGWNWKRWHFFDKFKDKKSPPRFVIEDGGAELAPGTGLYVHNPAAAGPAFYAMTAVHAGKEETALTEANATKAALTETPGIGAPVLQRKVKDYAAETGQSFNFIKKCAVDYYVRWDAPPNAATENRPNNYLVAVPEGCPTPASVGLHLHCWGGTMEDGYGFADGYKGGSIVIASNQEPYDWWTGHHEKFWSRNPNDWRQNEAPYKAGVVRPYSQNRMLAMLDWTTPKYNLDREKVFLKGNSMGGSGAVMFAIRRPERFAWCNSWVGIHNPDGSDHFRGSYENSYGKKEWGVKFEDGTPVWDHFNDIWYLKHHVKTGIPLLIFANGKDDYAIGWPQAAEFVRALQETRQPHIFCWEMQDHSTRSRMPVSLSDTPPMLIDLKVGMSLPAFTKCSLDDDPGTGKQVVEGKPQPRKNAYDGAEKGQINLYLMWETADLVDEADRWELTARLVEKAPQGECTVDITPRRLQKMTVAPGGAYAWSVAGADGKVLQSGEVKADADGLVTLEQVKLAKAARRVKVAKKQ